jgi:protein-S-isoprenylcysteine O-methyltransferase Ste14
MNLRERWVNYLYRAATGSQKYRPIRTSIGLTIFGLFTALFILFAIISDRVLNLSWPFPDKLTQITAYILLIIGAGLIVWTGFLFRKERGTPVPVNPPRELIVDGPYKLTRNPMLTGVFLAMIGLGLLIHSLSLVFVFTPLYALAHAWELKQIEEPELTKRFGDEFISYRERTPMFFPGIRPRNR